MRSSLYTHVCPILQIDFLERPRHVESLRDLPDWYIVLRSDDGSLIHLNLQFTINAGVLPENDNKMDFCVKRLFDELRKALKKPEFQQKFQLTRYASLNDNYVKSQVKMIELKFKALLTSVRRTTSMTSLAHCSVRKSKTVKMVVLEARLQRGITVRCFPVDYRLMTGKEPPEVHGNVALFGEKYQFSLFMSNYLKQSLWLSPEIIQQGFIEELKMSLPFAFVPDPVLEFNQTFLQSLRSNKVTESNEEEFAIE